MDWVDWNIWMKSVKNGDLQSKTNRNFLVCILKYLKFILFLVLSHVMPFNRKMAWKIFVYILLNTGATISHRDRGNRACCCNQIYIMHGFIYLFDARYIHPEFNETFTSHILRPNRFEDIEFQLRFDCQSRDIWKRFRFRQNLWDSETEKLDIGSNTLECQGNITPHVTRNSLVIGLIEFERGFKIMFDIMFHECCWVLLVPFP
jgi:hypothetical protein